MNWFENKTTQLIALVGIVTTLAGFGYQGAQYVNRLIPQTLYNKPAAEPRS